MEGKELARLPAALGRSILVETIRRGSLASLPPRDCVCRGGRCGTASSWRRPARSSGGRSDWGAGVHQLLHAALFHEVVEAPAFDHRDDVVELLARQRLTNET